MKLLKWGADYFQTQSLDPAVWIAAIGGAYGRLCSEAPALFISIALTVFVMVALAILFEEDFAKWRRRREMEAQGYSQLEKVDPGPTDEVVEALFAELDEDGGGTIDGEEMYRGLKRMFGDSIGDGDAHPSHANATREQCRVLAALTHVWTM